MSDESVRFHNGDTLDAIPVVRPTVPLPPGLRRLPPDPEVFPHSGLRFAPVVWVLAGAVILGAAVGGMVALTRKVDQVTEAVAPPDPATTESVTAVPMAQGITLADGARCSWGTRTGREMCFDEYMESFYLVEANTPAGDIASQNQVIVELPVQGWCIWEAYDDDRGRADCLDEVVIQFDQIR